MNGWRFAGAVCQALVLGTMLFVALARLVTLSLGTTVFKYQGF
jgi:hypothetical protein